MVYDSRHSLRTQSATTRYAIEAQASGQLVNYQWQH